MNRLSLPAALLVNLNIMLGSGVFINAVLLSQAAHGASSGAYLLGGLFILPLIVVLAELMHLHKGGTFLTFGTALHPLLGFLAAWGYFTAKLASAALSIHVFVTLVGLLFPSIGCCNPLIIDSALIVLFVLLNLMNIRLGTLVQYGFLGIKLIPLFLMIVGACIVGRWDIIQSISLSDIHALGTTIPFVLFALSGFEASCSLSSSLKNPEEDGPKAIWGSYTIALALLVLYQTAAYVLIAPGLSAIPTFKEAFPFAASMIAHGWEPLTRILTIAFFIGVAPSALGASYGILFSNGWNLHALMHAQRLPGSSFFLRKNAHGIPLWCFVAEGIFALCYLWLFKGAQVPLQQISALGSAGAYGISSIAYLAAKQPGRRSRLWGLIGILSVLTMIGFTIKSAFFYGIAGVATHIAVLACGAIISFLYTR